MTRMQADHAQLDDTLLEAVAPDDRAALERGLDAIAGRLRTLVEEAAP
jgi:hypothetical protein